MSCGLMNCDCNVQFEDKKQATANQQFLEEKTHLLNTEKAKIRLTTWKTVGECLPGLVQEHCRFVLGRASTKEVTIANAMMKPPAVFTPTVKRMKKKHARRATRISSEWLSM